MKNCTKCGSPKKLDELVKNTLTTSGRGSICLACDSERTRLRRLDPILRGQDLARAVSYRSVHRESLRIKGQGEKTASVAQMRSMAWSKVLQEIVKCELVCANCHRIRTQQRIPRAA